MPRHIEIGKRFIEFFYFSVNQNIIGIYLTVILLSGIIPNNLRHEETIVQITEALDNLDSAVLYIFNCIDKRLTENSQRYLSNIFPCIVKFF